MKTTLLMSAVALAILSSSAMAADLKYAPGDDGRFSWSSYDYLKKVDLQGEVITIRGPWLGPDKELVQSVIAYFEAATGADVQYAGSDSFEQQIAIDVQAGSAPNIAIFPQPGLAADLASKGFLTPLEQSWGPWIKDNYAAGTSWVDLGTFADKQGKDHLYGFFYKVDLKSLVWYVPENFEDAGYDVPESMEELKALTKQIVADGETPWCIGLGSGGATGWPATDWVEDMMLRTQSPADYDAWTKNELKFNDPKVIAAIDEFGWFLNDKYVDGGSRAVAATDFRDSPKGMFSSPAKCYFAPPSVVHTEFLP